MEAKVLYLLHNSTKSFTSLFNSLSISLDPGPKPVLGGFQIPRKSQDQCSRSPQVTKVITTNVKMNID